MKTLEISYSPAVPSVSHESAIVAAGAATRDKALRVSEARYRRLFETAKDGILLLNAKTAQIEDVNQFLIGLLGYSHAELLGKKLWEIGPFKDTAMNKEAFVELQAKRYIRYEDLPLQARDGRRISVEFVSNVYDCDGTDVIQCNIRDITARHAAELALKATARALQLLSQSNVALLSAKTERALLAEYCRIAVETGGCPMAWIGMADEGPDKLVNVVAHYARNDGDSPLELITWAQSDHGNGPTGRAIRTGEVQIVQDISTDPTMLPWRAEACLRGYLSCIALPFRLPENRIACMVLYSARRDVWTANEWRMFQDMVADLTYGITALQTALAKSEYQENLRGSLEQVIQAMADTMDERDPYTAGHQRRVANLCTRIGSELGLSADRIHGLHLAAAIHDLGKIGVPAEILAKPRRLTETEFNLLKEHVNTGFNILRKVSFPWPIATIVQQHHERIDGSGYPLGLRGDAQLLESKVLAVADVVEAMASHRPYRATLGIEAALHEIETHRGTTFDAQVVDACLRLFRQGGYKIED